jgi:hypothetical protein
VPTGQTLTAPRNPHKAGFVLESRRLVSDLHRASHPMPPRLGHHHTGTKEGMAGRPQRTLRSLRQNLRPNPRRTGLDESVFHAVRLPYPATTHAGEHTCQPREWHWQSVGAPLKRSARAPLRVLPLLKLWKCFEHDR